MNKEAIELTKKLVENSIPVTLIIPFQGPDQVKRTYEVKVRKIEQYAGKSNWAKSDVDAPAVCLDDALTSWLYVGENKKPLYSPAGPNITHLSGAFLYLITKYEDIRPGHIYVSSLKEAPYKVIVDKGTYKDMINKAHSQSEIIVPIEIYGCQDYNDDSPAILIHNIINNSLRIVIWSYGLTILTNI